MKRIAVLAALLAVTWAAPAFAHECPLDLKEIDKAMPGAASRLSAEDIENIKKWRAEGEELHNAGKHKEALEILDKAKTKLGI